MDGGCIYIYMYVILCVYIYMHIYIWYVIYTVYIYIYSWMGEHELASQFKTGRLCFVCLMYGQYAS